jgi:hypothetical protein
VCGLYSYLSNTRCAGPIDCHLKLSLLYQIFSELFHTKNYDFRKKNWTQKCFFLIFFTGFFPENFIMLRKNQGDIIINGHWSSCEEMFIPVKFKFIFNFLERFLKYFQTPYFMKIRWAGAEMFHADRQTD